MWELLHFKEREEGRRNGMLTGRTRAGKETEKRKEVINLHQI
jgi:hypothetical protein